VRLESQDGNRCRFVKDIDLLFFPRAHRQTTRTWHAEKSYSRDYVIVVNVNLPERWLWCAKSRCTGLPVPSKTYNTYLAADERRARRSRRPVIHRHLISQRASHLGSPGPELALLRTASYLSRAGNVENVEIRCESFSIDVSIRRTVESSRKERGIKSLAFPRGFRWPRAATSTPMRCAYPRHGNILESFDGRSIADSACIATGEARMRRNRDVPLWSRYGSPRSTRLGLPTRPPRTLSSRSSMYL